MRIVDNIPAHTVEADDFIQLPDDSIVQVVSVEEAGDSVDIVIFSYVDEFGDIDQIDLEADHVVGLAMDDLEEEI